MNIVKHLVNSRGIRNTLSRAVVVSKRFGITSRKIEADLNSYVDIAEKFNCIPTFAITALTLRRHSELIKKLSDRNVEFAIHGYVHADYTQLSLEDQIRHFERAMNIFRTCQIPFKGFRLPYLRWNENTLQAVGKLKFLYDSSQTILWDVVSKDKHREAAWNVYNKVLDLYNPKSAKEYLALPKIENGLVEIPISIPDDEAITDRLCITDKKKITELFEAIFEETYTRGELFTLQLHHERIPFYRSALETVLQRARQLNPTVWIATLEEIAKWWKEKDKFTFRVNSQVNGKYTISAECSERATVLVRSCKVNKPTSDWAYGYKTIENRNFTIESFIKPFIGVKPDSSTGAISFLRSEGFVVEKSEQPDNYRIYFDNLAGFQEIDEKPTSETIKNSTAPLLRFWRWPNKAKSALAITGDIDSITLIDFIMRLFGR